MSQSTQPTPPIPPNATPPARRANGPAIASLVCGILGCIPFLTGLAAIILGIVGIRKTRDPQVSGKGMAIAGLVLGLLSFGGWTLFGGGMYAMFRAAAPARATAEQFTRDLSGGNVEAALANSAAGMDRATLVAASEVMKAWGPLTSFGTSSVKLDSIFGASRYTLEGDATFAKATKHYTMRLTMEGGSYKVSMFNFK